jgi:hypothetical protein
VVPGTAYLPVHTAEACNGAGQNEGDGAQGDPEHVADFPVSQAFSPQGKAQAVLFGERIEDGSEAPMAVFVEQTLFRIRAGIDVQIRQLARGVGYQLQSAGFPVALLQSEVVSDAEKPASEIAAALAPLEVLEQREEDFLNHFFAVVNVEAERQEISEETIAELIEQTDHFVLERENLRTRGDYGGGRDR